MQLQLVCKKLKVFSDDEKIWKKLFNIHFPCKKSGNNCTNTKCNCYENNYINNNSNNNKNNIISNEDSNSSNNFKYKQFFAEHFSPNMFVSFEY